MVELAIMAGFGVSLVFFFMGLGMFYESAHGGVNRRDFFAVGSMLIFVSFALIYTLFQYLANHPHIFD